MANTDKISKIYKEAMEIINRDEEAKYEYKILQNETNDLGRTVQQDKIRKKLSYDLVQMDWRNTLDKIFKIISVNNKFWDEEKERYNLRKYYKWNWFDIKELCTDYSNLFISKDIYKIIYHIIGNMKSVYIDDIEREKYLSNQSMYLN